VLAHEAGLTEVIDPLAGSYYVETLTTEIETSARALMDEIERRGGVIAAIESGWIQQQIADASWERQRQIESGERAVVGVNRFVEDEAVRVDIHRHLDAVAVARGAALRALRDERDAHRVAHALGGVRAIAAGEGNVMPALVEAVKAYATIGEICGTLREVFGEYRPAAVY
jgi:methylmalonyl-CoA mutase N-terminal domain/subunit